ncbi:MULTISPECIES: LysR family transcriptional regulator [Acutalibacteraceae]|uniref:LysR family transcriptional regulator n=1 Tax=Acutalibacteraceae TaxID=3082771 RepID=UPI001FA98DAC|nr:MULTISPECIES: LysR family transcriptional regulator [Acutalibacteraceae]
MFDNIFDNKEQIYEVYKEQSFSKAAKNMYISQPSLSAMVKRAEKSIGSEIFDRSSSPIRLTECGKQYIQCIEQIMELEHNFTNYMMDMKNLKTGSFSIGGSNLFASYILPPLIMAFNQKYPYIKIELVEDRTPWLIDQLSVGALDFIIENYELDEKIYERNFYQTEHLLLAVPKSFPVNRKLNSYQLSLKSIQDGTYLSSDVPSVPLGQLSQEPFILLKSNNDTSQRSLKLCKQSGFAPKVLLYLDQQVTAYNIACLGMGCCFVSDTLIRFRPAHDHVAYYKLQGNDAERNIYFYYKHNKYLTFAMKEFLQVIERHA